MKRFMLAMAMLASVFYSHNLFAATDEDDTAVRAFVASYQQALADADAKSIASLTHIPPQILAKHGGDKEAARATLQKFLAHMGNGGSQFSDAFAIERIDYDAAKQTATVYGTVKQRDGQAVTAQWQLIKEDGGWLLVRFAPM